MTTTVKLEMSLEEAQALLSKLLGEGSESPDSCPLCRELDVQLARLSRDAVRKLTKAIQEAQK